MSPEYTDQPIYIDSDEQLARYCKQWSHNPVLALDTEFIRTDTFYPIGALIQVSDGSHCFLLDPLSIKDFSPFVTLLVDSQIVKVLHSCSEDLEVFDRLFGVLPEPLFDTQVAAAMDGLGFSLSYQRMTEALLDIHVPKGETRSNWLQRPLTQSQIHYAALDVAYLPTMYQRLSDSLAAKGRATWLAEDCQRICDDYRRGGDVGDYLRRIKSAWRLNTEELATLHTLVGWREQMARQKDRPRGRILKDKSCVEIVRTKPANLQELAAITDVGHGTIRRYGEQILELLNSTNVTAPSLTAVPAPLPASTRNLIKALKKCVAQCAQELQMAEEMLARKKDFEAIARSGMDAGHYQLPLSLGGWRQPIIGDKLLRTAREFG